MSLPVRLSATGLSSGHRARRAETAAGSQICPVAAPAAADARVRCLRRPGDVGEGRVRALFLGELAGFGVGFAFGATPSLVDCCLIPQVASARRNGVDLGPYPHIRAVEDAASHHPAFVAARPDMQPGAQP